VKTIQVVSTQITGSKTLIHYKRMIVMRRARILDWTLVKKIFHPTQMMRVRIASDKL
jgi:hypothetical protein